MTFKQGIVIGIIIGGLMSLPFMAALTRPSYHMTIFLDGKDRPGVTFTAHHPFNVCANVNPSEVKP